MEKIFTKNKYRAEIDGLRAFAVIAVIINHFNKDALPSGYLGVDIFFVISGYVITSSLSTRKSENFREFITSFFERRIKRLIPALIPFTLITGLLICLFDPYPASSLITGITSLFGASNFYLLNISTDYFATTTLLNPFTHTWSLDVEEQFYLIFPLLIWFTGFGKKTKRCIRNLFLASSILIILSLSSYLYIYQINQSAAYFLLPTRFWEMATGCITFLLFEKNIFKKYKSSNITSFLLFLLIILVLFFPISKSILATFLVVFISAILILCLKKTDNIFYIFTNKIALHIGKISYSLYLWHWTILCISRWTIGIHIWTIPFQILLIYLLSFISYKWVELPFRQKEWSFEKWQTITKGILLLSITSIVLLVYGKPLKGKLFLGNYENEKLITRSRNNIKYGTDVAVNNIYNGTNCHYKKNTKFSENFNFDKCTIKKDSEKTIYFLGNSHTDHLRATHYKISNKLGFSIDGTTVSYCIFPSDSRQKECADIQVKQEERVLQKVKKGDLIVISNRYRIGDGNRWFDNKSSLKRLNSFSNKISIKGAKLILFGPTPEFDITIDECKKNWFKPFKDKKCTIKKIKLIERRQNTYSLFKYLSNDIFIYDPLEIICTNEKCSMTDNHGKPLYVDDNHFSDYANIEYIYKDFLFFLKINKLV